MRKFLVLLGVMAIFSNIATANGFINSSNITSYMKLFIQPIVSLVFVIALIYIASWAYTKLNKYNMKSFSNQDEQTIELTKAKLLSHLPLGQNKCINVVEINKRILVLGVTSTSINLLKEFDKNEITPQTLKTEIKGNKQDYQENDDFELIYKKYSKG